MGGNPNPLRRGLKPREIKKTVKDRASRPRERIDAQSASSDWIPAPMLHWEPLLEVASTRNLRYGEGDYVDDSLERALLLPTDLGELKNMRIQEVALSMKRYLGIVRLPKPTTPTILAPKFSFIMCLSQLVGYPGYL